MVYYDKKINDTYIYNAWLECIITNVKIGL